MKLLIPFLIPLFVLSCDRQPGEKITEPDAGNFTSFELSFDGGRFGGFSFFVDSTKIYFAPQFWLKGLDDSVKYGILPDSILQVVCETVDLLKRDTSIKSTGFDCDDCPVVAVEAIIAQDTIKLLQQGQEISPSINRIIRVLDDFIGATKHKTINSLMLLGTRSELVPPPPPRF